MFWSILLAVLAAEAIVALINVGTRAYTTGRWTEAGRISAMMANLEHLDKQMRILTTTQEQIKARVSTEVWDWQWRRNRKEDIYTKLVDAGDRLVQLFGQVALVAEHGTMDETKIELQKAIDAQRELWRLHSFASIFGNADCVKAVEGFYSGLKDLPTSQTPIKDWAETQEKRSVILVSNLIIAAKDDFDLLS